MSPDLLVLSASNGENLKLAERFADAGRARGMAAEVLVKGSTFELIHDRESFETMIVNEHVPAFLK